MRIIERGSLLDYAVRFQCTNCNTVFEVNRSEVGDYNCLETPGGDILMQEWTDECPYCHKKVTSKGFRIRRESEWNKTVIFNGVSYDVGDTVVANDLSDYEGLVGTITEIRAGEDKEMDNHGVDIYCAFAYPRFIRQRSDFSDFPPVDSVIMSPEMINLIKKKEKSE